MADERPVSFDCDGEPLFGLLHDVEAHEPRRGLVIVVGGPQYRVGSHRQFVLLARAVAAAGFPVLRFDYRGMGDSMGPSVEFEAIDGDIRAAVDTLVSHYPTLDSIALWGLCDAATAALFYAGNKADARVDGLVLLNPWVRTESGEARAQAQGYYGRRLKSVSAWLNLLKQPGRLLRVIGNLANVARRALSRSDADEAALPERVLASLGSFSGDALLMISGNDLTATEFLNVARDDHRCIKALESGRLTRRDHADADHTFSTAAWRGWVERETVSWMQR
ncbi:MAG: hydrolase 1, exosortase A system-associated [Pseudomonadota bacterium]